MNFLRTLRAFLNKYGANVAGFFWNAGTALQFLFGLIAWSPLQIASSLFNVASPTSYLLFGHTNRGVVIGSLLGIFGTFLAVFPEIAAGEVATIFGFAAFVFFVSLNIFGVPLTRRFAHADSPLIRVTFGHPRRLSGLGPFFCTRLPIIYASIAHDRWQLATVFAVWGLGDLALSFSRTKLP